jgi:DNA-binding transcriptional ArsR family regulator
LEIERETVKAPDKAQLFELKDKIINMVKEGEKDGGANIDQIILNLKESPDLINQEIKKLLEDGVIYEPRPGKIRYLG